MSGVDKNDTEKYIYIYKANGAISLNDWKIMFPCYYFNVVQQLYMLATKITILTFWDTNNTNTVNESRLLVKISYYVIINLLFGGFKLDAKEELQILSHLLNDTVFCSELDLVLVRHFVDIRIEATFTSLKTATFISHLSLHNVFDSEYFSKDFQKSLPTTFETLFYNNLQFLHTLDLSHNGLCDEFLVSFSILLRRNQNIQNLALRGNRFTDISIKGLATALYYNVSLKKLDISDNSFGAIGLLSITTSLRYNTSLLYLDVSTIPYRNFISEFDLSRALLFLQYNETITTLFCWNHGNSTTLHKTFNKILLFNATLQQLNNIFKNKHKAGYIGLRRRQNIFIMLHDNYFNH
jgi:Leucine Rich repeat